MYILSKGRRLATLTLWDSFCLNDSNLQSKRLASKSPKSSLNLNSPERWDAALFWGVPNNGILTGQPGLLSRSPPFPPHVSADPGQFDLCGFLQAASDGHHCMRTMLFSNSKWPTHWQKYFSRVLLNVHSYIAQKASLHYHNIARIKHYPWFIIHYLVA